MDWRKLGDYAIAITVALIIFASVLPIGFQMFNESITNATANLPGTASSLYQNIPLFVVIGIVLAIIGVAFKVRGR